MRIKSIILQNKKTGKKYKIQNKYTKMLPKKDKNRKFKKDTNFNNNYVA